MHFLRDPQTFQGIAGPISRLRAAVPSALAAFALAAVFGGACGQTPTPDSALRIGLAGEPVTMDPHLQDHAVTFTVLHNLFETLVTFDSERRIQPALAVSWSTPAEDVWRFRLRDGVTFHDGRPLTAEDVVGSLLRARDHDESRVDGYLASVTDVRAVDRTTVEVSTRGSAPLLLGKLALIYIVPVDAPPRISRPIGSGPYTLGDSEPGQSIAMRAFDGHWRGPPDVTRAEFHFFDRQGDRLDALRRGELDLIHEVPGVEAEELGKEPNLEIRERLGPRLHYLHLHPGRPPFDDLRIRAAVDLALDRGVLAEELLGGYGAAAGQMTNPEVFGYSPELRPTACDPEAARGLLREAGYPDGFDIDLHVREGRPAGPIVRQLARVGIRARAVASPWGELYPRLKSRDVGFYYGGWSSVSGDASDFLDNKAHTPDDARGLGGSNFVGFSDPEVDRLIEASSLAFNTETRRGLLQQAAVQIAEAKVFLPLVMISDLYAVRRDLEWQPRVDGRIVIAEMRLSEDP
ncbi:MAG: ABC transporter substrate-binding protein [Acidobacteriota bacterium]